MTIQELETKIIELKGQQAAFFQKKKADRDLDVLAEVRKELNELKAEAKAQYRKKN